MWTVLWGGPEGPGLEGLSCRSKAVVLTAFSSAPVSRVRLSVRVSAMRSSISDRSVRPFLGSPLEQLLFALLDRP